MTKGDDEYRSALDCNGFPIAVGDLVEMTELLDKKNAGARGAVAKVSPPNICFVQMEEQVDLGSDQAEVVAAAGFLWKLVAKGVEG